MTAASGRVEVPSYMHMQAIAPDADDPAEPVHEKQKKSQNCLTDLRTGKVLHPRFSMLFASVRRSNSHKRPNC